MAIDTKVHYGFKKKELEKCLGCSRGVAHDNNLIFYRVAVERFMLDPSGVQRTHGLETFFGGGAQGASLAAIMGDDPDIANCVDGKHTLLLCQDCALGVSREPCQPGVLLDKKLNQQEGTEPR